MSSLLLYLYAIVSLMASVATIRVVMVNLHHSTVLFRLGFVAVAGGCLSNAAGVLTGVVTHVSPGTMILVGGLLGVFTGMSWSRGHSSLQRAISRNN